MSCHHLPVVEPQERERETQMNDYYENDPAYGLTPIGAGKLNRVTVHWCDHDESARLCGLPHEPGDLTGRSFIGTFPRLLMDCADHVRANMATVPGRRLLIRRISETEAVMSDGSCVFIFREMSGSEAALIIAADERHTAEVVAFNKVEAAHKTWAIPSGEA
jgi:hypothetical protein